MNLIVWGTGRPTEAAALAKAYKTEGVTIRNCAEKDMPKRAHRFWLDHPWSWVVDVRNVDEDLRAALRTAIPLDPKIAGFHVPKARPAQVERAQEWKGKPVTPTLSVVNDWEGGPVVEDLVTLKELERRYVALVRQAVDGNRSRMARILGLNRRTIYRLPGALDGDTSEVSSVDEQQDASPLDERGFVVTE